MYDNEMEHRNLSLIKVMIVQPFITQTRVVFWHEAKIRLLWLDIVQ